VPSAFIVYSTVRPRSSTENATRPSEAISGLPTMRAPGDAQSVAAPPFVSFQMPSPDPVDET
jgi:hypothetical protein